MAAVAPASVMHGSHEPEAEQTDHSPSRFTAVNGKDSTPHPVIPSAPPPQHGNIEPPERFGGDAANAGSEQAQSTLAGTSKTKRKRSESLDHHSSANGDHQTLPATLDSRREGSEQQSAPATTWADYNSHQLVSQAQKAQSLDTSDAQLAEALQRETQQSAPDQKSWNAVSRPPDAADQRPTATPPAATQPQSDKAQQNQAGPPKRKRVFSNRTKTGCLTCRRRKKKCDEAHPACNNCIRGGFMCEGYPLRNTWQKPTGLKGPISLQSKDGYVDVNNHYVTDPNAARPDRMIEGPQAADPSKIRHTSVVEDNDRTNAQYMGSPTNTATTRSSWPTPRWPAAGQLSYAPDPVGKPEYRDVPSIHELARDGGSGQQQKTDYMVPLIRDLSQQSAAHTTTKPMTAYPTPGDSRSSHPSAMDANSPQTQARLALSIEHQLSSSRPPGEKSEREKMINGELYRPYDMQLIEDRDRCKAALWRFNNACNPQNGISIKEQNRLLREVIIGPPPSPGSSSSPRPMGSIGQGAVVEAPFRCHYGYNIHIGEDVLISENCCMVDDCPINIGAHTWIGPNVTILGAMALANMQERKGSQSRYQGRPVIIEEDCYVGANSIIYPGVRLRRGAYVAPGEVVRSDIVAYGFQGLKPIYM